MTEDELLEQIRTIDPDAYVEEVNALRVIRTTALQSSVTLFVNPANMQIIHMDPLVLDIQPGESAITMSIVGADDHDERMSGFGTTDGFD